MIKEFADGEHDYGFTALDEEELIVNETDKIRKLRTAIYEIRALVIPLLTNLKANPKKNMIKWNGVERETKINDLIARIDKCINEATHDIA